MFKRSVASGVLLISFALTAFSKDLPYKGEAVGDVIESIALGDPVMNGAPFLHERAVAIGHFTHLGRASIELDWMVSAKAEARWSGLVIEGTYIITGANGDSMSGTFVSHQLFDSEDFIIQVQVLSGTGRFSDASGDIPGIGHRAGNDFGYELDGLITLPDKETGSHKKVTSEEGDRWNDSEFDDVAE